MKRYLTVIVCLMLVLLLWGCNQADKPAETTDTTISEAIGAEPLTEEELRWFDEEFFSDIREDVQDFNIRNMFLRCEYDTPENIDLGVVFREGLGENGAVSQEEIALYNEVTGNDWMLDYAKISKEDMDTIFLANTGLLPSETSKAGLDKLVYLEEYDAYYHCHGDTAYLYPEILSGERADDGTVSLYYRDSFSDPSPLWCVTLKPAGDTYLFVSNLPAE